jgi:hypothetical protein
MRESSMATMRFGGILARNTNALINSEAPFDWLRRQLVYFKSIEAYRSSLE